MKYLIVIGGATAVGKTQVAIRLAQEYNCEILSADSRQFYKELNIGTAKPTKEELDSVPHHFINNLSVRDDYSVGDYERDVLKKLESIYMNQDVAVLVGGTGLYINAVLNGLDSFPDVPKDIKDNYESIFASQGIKSLQLLLTEKDPEYAQKVDMNNPHRIIRALSIIEISGSTFSSFLTSKKIERPFRVIKIALTMERHLLYDRINKRVDQMIESGLVNEAKSLIGHKHLNALRTVGYSELFQHFDGKYFMSEAIEKIKQNTRNYAKRQSHVV